MLKNIYHSAERIFDMESANTPGLTDGTPLHRNLAFLNAAQCVIKIVHLNGQIGHLGVGAALACKADLHGHLRGTSICASPAIVHGWVETRYASVELVHNRRLRRWDVGNDSLDLHVATSAAVCAP